VSRFQFVADHRHAYEVKRLCEIVQVARSSFYAWMGAAPVRAARTAAVPAGTWSTASVAYARRCHCVSLTVNDQVGSVTFGSVLFTC
jgi:hypothetical protein